LKSVQYALSVCFDNPLFSKRKMGIHLRYFSEHIYNSFLVPKRGEGYLVPTHTAIKYRADTQVCPYKTF